MPRLDAGLQFKTRVRGAMFEQAGEMCGNPKGCENWKNGNVSSIVGEQNITLADSKLTAESLAEMVKAIDSKTISNTAGKTVIEKLMAEGGKVSEIIEREGLCKISDTSALDAIVIDLMAANAHTI